MKIGFYISNWGGSPLQVGLERGLKELGHEVTYDTTCFSDLTLIFNQSAHIPDYVYPESFPTGKIAFIDCAEYGYFKRLPAVAKAYQNAFSYGSMQHDTKNQAEQDKLLHNLQGKSFPYFIREYIKFLDWPGNYYPIDYPLYAPSVCEQRPDKSEYLARTKDFWVSWGLSHPWRKPLSELIRSYPHKDATVINLEEDGATRMPHPEYFANISKAKCSINFDGYGSSSFRLTESLVRTVLLRGPLSIKQHAPLTNGLNCIDFEITNSDESFLGSNINDKIEEVVMNPARSYAIYEQGYHHCMAFLTERATAHYVLNTIEGHDYTKETKLLL